MTYKTVTATATETTLVESALTTDGQVYTTLDLVNLAAGDTFVVRTYVKVDGTNYRKADEITFSGAQDFPAVRIADEWANGDMDFKITMQRTAGVDRVIGVRTATRT